MADRKAVNRWYPPDWDPSKGSLNTYHGESWRNGSATVNGRAGAAKGIQIIRFEAPWNFWCTTCNKMVGRGVRYNAEKKKAGKYYTTTVWSFTMKCHLCSGEIVIETDPKNDDYRIVSGGRRKEEVWKASSTETHELMTSADKDKLAADPMYRLEHGEADKRKARSASSAIATLIKTQTKSDYDENAKLRRAFRSKRKAIEADQSAGAALLAKSSLAQSAVAILPEHPHDRALARRARFGGRGGDSIDQQKRAVAKGSIFPTTAPAPGPGGTIQRKGSAPAPGSGGKGTRGTASAAGGATARAQRAGKAAARGLNPGKFRLLDASGKGSKETPSVADALRAAVRRRSEGDPPSAPRPTADEAVATSTPPSSVGGGVPLVTGYDSD
eukprot:m.149146 g.149146  ORF g.149146 m.149146 type:complete len:385 (+) comp14225_c0_seq7:333-1487(+)